jgi:hypothetical protein
LPMNHNLPVPQPVGTTKVTILSSNNHSVLCTLQAIPVAEIARHYTCEIRFFVCLQKQIYKK